MAERIIKIPIGELTTVRIRCLRCDTIAEIATDQLGEKFRRGVCLFCGNLLQTANTPENGFELLRMAFQAFAGRKDMVQVEFPVKGDL